MPQIRDEESGQFGFGRQVLGFSRKVYKARDRIFKEALYTLIDRLQVLCPKDTFFLMSSLEASTKGTPRMTRPNPNPNAPKGSFSWDSGEVFAIIDNAEFGETIYLGYTAEYAALVHDGHGFAEPQPWVSIITQQWQDIVKEATSKVRQDA